MCIIVHKPAGVDVKESILSKCYQSNSDGWGFAAYTDEGVVVTDKDTTPFEDFMERYSPYSQKESVLHFRIASVGSKKVDNCHPFDLGLPRGVGQGIQLFHNGTLHSYKEADKTDTEVFGQVVLAPLVERYGEEVLTDPIVKVLIEDYIGGSKLVLMSPTTMPVIYNRDKGEEDENCWFSNTSYKMYGKGFGKGGKVYDVRDTSWYNPKGGRPSVGLGFWDIPKEGEWEEVLNATSHYAGGTAYKVDTAGTDSEMLTIDGKLRAKITAHFKCSTEKIIYYGLVLHTYNAKHEWGGDIAIRLTDYDYQTLFDIGDFKLKRLSTKVPSEVVQKAITKYFVDTMWASMSGVTK